MPTPVAKGIIITVSALIAAGIAVYESPQFRQWVNNSRRKIALALHNLGDEINPHDAPFRQDISMTEEVGAAAEERRRIARAELERRRSLLEERRKGMARGPTNSFDTLVDEHGRLLDTAESSDNPLANSTAVEVATSQSVHRGKMTRASTLLPDESPAQTNTHEPSQPLQLDIPSPRARSPSLAEFTPVFEAGGQLGMSFLSTVEHEEQRVTGDIGSDSSHTEGHSEVLFDHPMDWPTNETERDLRSPFSDLAELQFQQERASTPSTSDSYSQIYESAIDAASDGTLSDLGRSTGVATPTSWSEVGSVISSEEHIHHL
ncbi:uncharacterized protein BP01DRAFT_353611 [Aspergillus saccharolyticus JOP 1030-1]|uniref:Uncharacterized protein n=1 Tax=Aspergillus saccharolyticus JOP 1030-1 TaxID=1450539 RepID=A0A318ZLP9_9EURO|nr:hypothetical protein BP01DRAFT_353611 [Aspergillus saccharolyticus JOP 1030-1]PYH48456.1 hypothetical protein BP01DRAFT_353611 [Aspergillus saccharolyticus JOP 1030-1]